MPETQWDVDNIRTKLATNTASVEWAILALDARQTETERESGKTIDENGRGWNATDAGYGTYLANWIKKSRRPKGSRLDGKFVIDARKMLHKYAGQLSKIVAEKAQKKPAIGVAQQTVVPRSQWHPTFAQEPF